MKTVQKRKNDTVQKTECFYKRKLLHIPVATCTHIHTEDILNTYMYKKDTVHVFCTYTYLNHCHYVRTKQYHAQTCTHVDGITPTNQSDIQLISRCISTCILLTTPLPLWAGTLEVDCMTQSDQVALLWELECTVDACVCPA